MKEKKSEKKTFPYDIANLSGMVLIESSEKNHFKRISGRVRA